jgi:hypothetical protein
MSDRAQDSCELPLDSLPETALCGESELESAIQIQCSHESRCLRRWFRGAKKPRREYGPTTELNA